MPGQFGDLIYVKAFLSNFIEDICVCHRDVDPILARKKPGSGALYLERREIFKILLNEYFR